MKKKSAQEGQEQAAKPAEPGNPSYDSREDIYARDKREADLDPDELRPVSSRDQSEWPADDLDIPGAELDDSDEEIGEEDEENNYYSLGGDNHEDLEEDQS